MLNARKVKKISNEAQEAIDKKELKKFRKELKKDKKEFCWKIYKAALRGEDVLVSPSKACLGFDLSPQGVEARKEFQNFFEKRGFKVHFTHNLNYDVIISWKEV